MNYGLEEKIEQQILSVFQSFPEVERVILYGSRAKGNFRPASDIDLVLCGKNLSSELLNKLSWALDDLLLPYTFDLSLHENIKQEDLLEHIERVGKEFYTR